MQAREIYYKPSGKFGIASFITIPLLGAIGACLGGFAYSYAVSWIPFIYVNVLLTIAYGFVMGFMVYMGANLGKLRNVPLALLLSLVVGVFALYTQWVAHFHALTDPSQLILDPLLLWQYITTLGETGSWSIGSSKEPINGILLYLVWGIEAIIIIGLTFFMAMAAVNQLFCENCGQWTSDEQTFGPFKKVKDLNQTRNELENHNFYTLENLEPADHARYYATIKMEGCGAPDCHQKLNAITLQNISITENEKGETETDEVTVVEGLLITQATRERLIQSFNEIQQAYASPDSDDNAPKENEQEFS